MVKGYVISVYDYECDNVEIEGVFKNICEAIKKINNVTTELYENAYMNNNAVITLAHHYDKDMLINKAIISGGDRELFKIELHKTNIE